MKLVLPGLKYYKMLIRNITDLIGAIHYFLTCLGASQVKGFKASRVTIHGDIVVPREIVKVKAH
jgi:hypothetical protein